MPTLSSAPANLLVMRLRTLAQVTGVPVGTINKIASIVRQTDAEAMFVAGMSTRDIGRCMGVSHTTVENWLGVLRKVREHAEVADQDLRGYFERKFGMIWAKALAAASFVIGMLDIIGGFARPSLVNAIIYGPVHIACAIVLWKLATAAEKPEPPEPTRVESRS
jgi:hypothetical protein